MAANLLAAMNGRILTVTDGYNARPLVTARDRMLLAEFENYHLNPTPGSFPLINPFKERRTMWAFKRYGLPPVYLPVRHAHRPPTGPPDIPRPGRSPRPRRRPDPLIPPGVWSTLLFPTRRSSAMFFAQYYLDCLSQASYMIADSDHRRAVVVDPRRDVSEYLTDAAAHGFTIEAVVNTHFHADFPPATWSWPTAPAPGSATGSAPRPSTPSAS